MRTRTRTRHRRPWPPPTEAGPVAETPGEAQPEQTQDQARNRTGRDEALRPIVQGLEASRRAGMVYLSEQGRKRDSGYSWPWPPPGSERAEVLRLIVDQLNRVRGPWRVWFVEEGTSDRRAYAWPWPQEGEADEPARVAGGG